MPQARAEIGSYVLFDMKDGAILAAHEPTRLWYPASITKLMTAYVTFEAVRDGRVKMTSPVRISPQARQQPPSRMGFALGTVITVETALRIILTKSANDVSVALAEAIGGTQAGFVGRMNAAAVRLGMASTQYDNPHGLPNRRQVTTARDIALLMMALARDFPDRGDFFAMGGVRLGKKVMPNHNSLVRKVRGADGMKTGFICSSGFNLAATVTRDGVRLGAVVLGGLTSRERDERTAELLEKGFDALQDGGSVRLDGFDKADGRLDVVPVAGTRGPMGTIAGLEPPVDGSEPADRKDVVCGASRPSTRYDDGTVQTAADVDHQRSAVLAYQVRLGALKARAQTVLAAPRPEQSPIPDAPAFVRAMADAAMRPPEWALSSPEPRPLRRPGDPSNLDATSDAPADYGPSGAGTQPGVTGAIAVTAVPANPDLASANPLPAASAPPATQPAVPAADVASMAAQPASILSLALAPADWRPSPAFPPANPLEVAGMREAIPEPPPQRPLTYLGPSVWIGPVDIAIGGADAERPDPLSGAIVGGGPPPRPRPRPAGGPDEFGSRIDPDDMMRHVSAVRGAAAAE